MRKHTISSIIILLVSILLSGCNEFASPSPSGGYYDNYNNHYGSYDNYYERRERERLRDERHDINREKERIEDERQRLEEERRRQQQQYRPPPPPPERCPSGYSPSENKCSVEERRRGCKDMRLPGGLGCVRR